MMLDHMTDKHRLQRLYDHLKSLGLYVWGVPVPGQPDDENCEMDYICVAIKRPMAVCSPEERRSLPYLWLVNSPDEQRSSSSRADEDST